MQRMKRSTMNKHKLAKKIFNETMIIPHKILVPCGMWQAAEKQYWKVSEICEHQMQIFVEERFEELYRD